jgi:hypothetical protein
VIKSNILGTSQVLKISQILVSLVVRKNKNQWRWRPAASAPPKEAVSLVCRKDCSFDILGYRADMICCLSFRRSNDNGRVSYYPFGSIETKNSLQKNLTNSKSFASVDVRARTSGASGTKGIELEYDLLLRPPY